MQLTSSKPKVEPQNIYDRSVHCLKENIKNTTGLDICKVAIWIPMWQMHANGSRFQKTDSDNTRQLWVYLFLSTEQKKNEDNIHLHAVLHCRKLDQTSILE